MSTLYAGIDLGGTKIACGLATADGKIVADRAVATGSHEGPDAVIQRIADLVNALANETETRPAAVGIGVPGLADVGRGMTKFLPNMPTQWRDVPVRELLSPKVGCAVHLLNDARAATLGELVFGHGRGVKDMIFYTLGTGIGGGVVIDGKLRLGPLGAAGELGHVTILPDGPLCGCGSRGCLETLASGPALTGEGVRLLRSGQAPILYERIGGDISRVTPKAMAEAASAGDKAIHEAIRRVGYYLGLGVANVISTLHPELVVFGGGVAEMGSVLIDVVRETACKHVGMFPATAIRFEQSELRERAGIMGGVAAAMQAGLPVAAGSIHQANQTNKS